MELDKNELLNFLEKILPENAMLKIEVGFKYEHVDVNVDGHGHPLKRLYGPRTSRVKIEFNEEFNQEIMEYMNELKGINVIDSKKSLYQCGR